MAKRAEGFKEWHGITIGKETMYILDEGSKFEIVIGSPGDGPSPHCFIHDEFHEQLTFAQYDTAKTGAMAREQSLQIMISTAGVDTESPCRELQEELEQVLEGVIPNDRLFGLVYTVDDPGGASSNCPTGARCSTGQRSMRSRRRIRNYGVSVLADKIAAEHNKLSSAPRARMHLRPRTRTSGLMLAPAGWNMIEWRACADPSLAIDDFVEDPCHEGEDLGAKLDLSSRCKVFVRWQDGKRHYYLFGSHYLCRSIAPMTASISIMKSGSRRAPSSAIPAPRFNWPRCRPTSRKTCRGSIMRGSVSILIRRCR